MGQYELRDLMERCGYNGRFRDGSIIPLPILPLREVLRGDLHEATDGPRSSPTSASDDAEFFKLIEFYFVGQGDGIPLAGSGCIDSSPSC